MLTTAGMGTTHSDNPVDDRIAQKDRLPLKHPTPQNTGASVERYKVVKTYGNELGLSCCFRQHLARHSHCQLLHGYALGVRLTFTSNILNEQGWVIDFGGLDPIKQWLKSMFDHTVVIAVDDPCLHVFQGLVDQGLIDLRIVEAVGCEAFAKMIHEKVSGLISNINSLATLYSVEVFEHGANSAIYIVEQPFRSDDGNLGG